MHSAIAGFLTGLSLIVAIGAQNAYVLRLGLTRQHVGLAVALCAISDVVLIFAGIAGIGGVVRSFPSVLDVLKWVGVDVPRWVRTAILLARSSTRDAPSIGR